MVKNIMSSLLGFRAQGFIVRSELSVIVNPYFHVQLLGFIHENCFCSVFKLFILLSWSNINSSLNYLKCYNFCKFYLTFWVNKK